MHFKKHICVHICVIFGCGTISLFGQVNEEVKLLPSFLEGNFLKVERHPPLPPRRSPHAFHLKKNDRIAFLGDGLLEREQWIGHLETRLTIRYPQHRLRFRNLSWSGDTPTGKARARFDWHRDEASWFEQIQKPLLEFKPNIMILGYGMSSSFDGKKGLDKFKKDYERLIDRLEKTFPKSSLRLVLIGPIKHERLPHLPDPTRHNQALAEYSAVIEEIAEKQNLPFVNLFNCLGDGSDSNISRSHTDDGIHLNAYGYSRLADVYSTTLGADSILWQLGLGRDGTRASRIAGNEVSDVMNLNRKRIFKVRDLNLPFPNRDEKGRAYPTSQRLRRIGFMHLSEGRHLLKIDGKPIMTHRHDRWSSGMALTRGPMFQQAEDLRKLIVKKNALFFHRFRPQNYTYLFGFRSHEQGRHADEIEEFDRLISEMEEDIFRLSIPRKHHYELVALSDDEVDPAKVSKVSKVSNDQNDSKVSKVANDQNDQFENHDSQFKDQDQIIKQPLPKFKLAEGFQISLYARDPLLHKPIQMNFDPKGRLWVASSSVYPQILPGQKADDSIVILEDRDGNGVAETSTLFAKGLMIPTGIEPGNGGAYVSQGTDLLHFEDTDDDGKADHRRMILSGFGTEDTHHLLHTLRWGNDGQLYMNQSIYIHSHIETPHGVKRLNSGGIWHFRPDTLELDVFVKGFCNPWGHHFDDFGQSFITDGAGFQGLSYGVPGAMYFTYSQAPRLLESISPGNYPKYCGLEILYSKHFPKKWQGAAITCDFRSHRIVPFTISEKGSGYVAQEQPEWVRGLDNTFRPIDVKIGPDGALYVADWANPIIQHGEVDFRDPRRDKAHGRIWRITHEGSPIINASDFTTFSDLELLESLISKNGYDRHQARRVLTERGKSIRKMLARWVRSKRAEKDEDALLQALWIYQSIDHVEPQLLHHLLEAEDGRIRSAAVRVLRFWRDRIEGNLDLLAKRIHDEHPRVRLEAVRALSFEGNAKAAAALLEVLQHPMDRFLDYATWMSIRELSEPWINALRAGIWRSEGRERQLEFALKSIETKQASEVLSSIFQSSKMDEKGPWIELIGRAGSAEDLDALLKKMVKGDLGEAASLRAIDALEKAHRLRKMSPNEDATSISELFDHPDPSLQSAALRLAGTWKLHAFEGDFQTKASSRKTPRPAREAAIAALCNLDSQSAYEKLKELLVDADSMTLQPQIARSMASMNLPEAINSIFGILKNLRDEADLKGVWETMLQQKGADAIVRKALRETMLSKPVAEVGIRVARESGRHWSDLILAIEEAGNLIPNNDEMSRSNIQKMAKQAMSKGDPDRGEDVYRRLSLGCVLCHGIGGAGGKVGPDLTSIGASAPIDYLVESLLLPNAKIKEGYGAWIVETKDGEEYGGILIREDASELVLRDASNRLISIVKQNVAHRIEGASLMPAGLIDGLTDLEKADLFRFLSELGKSGRFDATRGNVARLWKLRAGRHTDEQFGIEFILSKKSESQWKSAMTLVDGRLRSDEIKQALDLKNSNRSSLIGVFASTQFQVPQSENVTLRLSAPADSSLWIDGKSSPFSREKQLSLEAGTHRVVLKLNPHDLPESIRAECDEATFLIE